MKRFLLTATVLFFVSLCNYVCAQNCPKGSHSVHFSSSNSQVQIIACIQDEVSLGKQSVFWGAKNLTNDKLYIKFVKVVTTTCGNVLRSDGDTYLDPGQFVGGTTFSGEITFETQVWGEDCADPKSRVRSVAYENLVIKNLSQEERDKAAQQKKAAAEEEKKEELAAKKKQEEDKKIAAQKQEEERKEIEQKKQEEAKRRYEEKQREEEEAAERKRIQDSLARAATDARVAAKQAAVQQSNDAMGNAALSVINVAGLMNDAYIDRPVCGRVYFGLGWDQIPVIANDDNHSATSTEVTSHPVIALGFTFSFFNNRGISLHLSPFGTFGLDALDPGATGSHLTYGGNATLLLSPKAKNLFKLFAEGGYTERSGTWSYDQDAGDASLGITTYTNVVKNADYDYSVIRYGGGFMLDFINGDNETYIRPGIFFETPSFAPYIKTPVMVGNLQILMSSFLLLDISYSKDYFIAGTATYAKNFDKSNQDFFSIRLVKTGLMFPH
jgi:hypothetical protein